MNRLNRFIPIITLLVLLLVTLTTSCDKRLPLPTDTTPPDSQVRIITSITASPDTIYNDNHITFSEISVTVKDGEGFGVGGQIVNFRTTLGQILVNVATDSTGVATTTLWDDGRTGTANVTAVVRNYSPTNVEEIVSEADTTIAVTIMEVPQIQSISLNFPSTMNPYPMQVMQVTEISATATNALGNLVPNNTLIAFTCTKGRFVDSAGNVLGSSIVAQTVNGRATVNYSAGATATTTPGSDNAFVTAAIGTISSIREVIIRPGSPFALGLQSFVQVGDQMIEADTSFVSSPNQIFMRASLSDMHGNPCQTKPVRFETNLGTFLNTSQMITINTDNSGLAQVQFTPGLTAGAATIKAFANNDTLQTQLIFNVTSDDIHSISFTQVGQIDLNVVNTGGVESAILRVNLKDINGNLVDVADSVYFRIMNPRPDDDIPANLNNNFPVGDSVMVLSTGGQAQISVNSGTASQILIIRASCVNRSGRWVQATKANIVIHAGPPAVIVPFIGGFNTGQNMGGGLWRVIAGAVVKDIHGNSVDRGTSVYFSIPAEIQINPLVNCQIVANAYVGNVSVDDDSLSGVAYTVLTYSGVFTNDKVVIRAQTGAVTPEDTFDDVYGDAIVSLPLNDPRFEMQALPTSLIFGDDTPNWKYADIYFVLSDGQGQPVGNAAVMLTSTGGQFVAIPGYNNNYPTDPAWRIITYYDYEDPNDTISSDYAGWAWGNIGFNRLECGVGDPVAEVPGTATHTITARILGSSVTVETNVTLYRYWTPGPPF